MNLEDVFLGVDVGTGSVRCACVSNSGKVLGSASVSIRTWKELKHVEQSSNNIWSATCSAVKEGLRNSNVKPEQVKGIGFDATCSLVVLGENDLPVSVSLSNNRERNIIVWMDHRATDEALEINSINPEVLKFVGNSISPEMHIPKLMWLKRHKISSYKKAEKFIGLPDFLVYRATGVDKRSMCSAVCKWNYFPDGIGWDQDYLKAVGLLDLEENNFAKLGGTPVSLGTKVGGLSRISSVELGLIEGTPVSSSIIDAHAGGIGILGFSESVDISSRLACICGTSICCMAVSSGENPRFIPGVWGPYASAMVPGMSLNEAGQSAAGSLIEHVITSHAAFSKLGKSVVDATLYLNQKLAAMVHSSSPDWREWSKLTESFHILPYFLGNRSPRADPELTGVAVGLTLDSSVENLAVTYLAVIQAICYGTRHIIQTLNNNGYCIETLVVCGGLSKNRVFVQEMADCCQLQIVLPEEDEAVLLGAAMLGAVASGKQKTVLEGMAHMSKDGALVSPRLEMCSFHSNKFEVFLRMYENWQEYKLIMAKGS